MEERYECMRKENVELVCLIFIVQLRTARNNKPGKVDRCYILDDLRGQSVGLEYQSCRLAAEFPNFQMKLREKMSHPKTRDWSVEAKTSPSSSGP